MRKADDSRRTKKYPQKNRVRNLAKASNENSINVNEATTKAKNQQR